MKVFKILFIVFLLGVVFSSCSKNVSKADIPKKIVAKKSVKKNLEILTFVYKGNAKEVYLSGNFNQWKINDPKFIFKKLKNNEWILELRSDLFKKGRNEYKLIVDGEWKIDLNAKKIENSGLSGKVGVFYIK